MSLSYLTDEYRLFVLEISDENVFEELIFPEKGVFAVFFRIFVKLDKISFVLKTACFCYFGCFGYF